MRTWHFFNKKTGLFLDRRFATTDASRLPLNIPAGHAPIEGSYDHLSQCVAVGRLADGEEATAEHVIDYQPGAPSEHHEWDPATKRWRLNPEMAAAMQADHRAREAIQDLELRVQPRALREAALGIGGARDRLAEIDRQIAALREALISN